MVTVPDPTFQGSHGRDEAGLVKEKVSSRALALTQTPVTLPEACSSGDNTSSAPAATALDTGGALVGWSNTRRRVSPLSRPTLCPPSVAMAETMAGGDGAPQVPPTTSVAGALGGDPPPALWMPATVTVNRPPATSTAVGITPLASWTRITSSRPPLRHVATVTPMGREKVTRVGVTGDALVGDEKVRVTTSPALNPTIRGGGFDAMADKRPGQHCAAPALLPSPGPHGAHTDAVGAAASELNRPGAHAVHVSLDVVPVTSLKRPCGQACLGPPAQ